LALTWDAVDFAARQVIVEEEMQRVKDDVTGRSSLQRLDTKSETSNRTIKLPPFLLDALAAHRDQQRQFAEDRHAAGQRWADRGLVFCTKFGNPFDGPNVTKYFQAHLNRVGLPHLRFHDLRHSAVSFMAAEGVPVEVARAILGHSDARLTMNVYRHILDEEHERAAEAIGKIFGGS
jgi:integrase